MMATQAPSGDPRLTLSDRPADDIRPVVARRSLAPSGLAIGMVVVLFAVLLFVVLDARRRSGGVPDVRVTAADRTQGAAGDPPPLYVPAANPSAAVMPFVPPGPQRMPFILPQPPVAQPRVVYVPQAAPPDNYPQPPMPMPPMMPAREVSNQALVLDLSGPQAAGASSGEEGAAEVQSATARATATVLANRATTVAQGTLIPAVLETGFDSTKAGFARAIVTRDVRGFDGSRVLIPRGSRLTGEYAGGADAGQRRAIINWTRLVRPDGVVIAIGSPATDEMGRGGIRANVNSHFLARIFPAILQSALDIGVNVASGPRGGALVLATGGGGGGGSQNPPAPTLTVRPGTSIAIFVSRDLDFTGVGSPR